MAEPQQATLQHLQRRRRVDSLRPTPGTGRLLAAVAGNPAKHVDRLELVEPEQIIARIPIPGALAGKSTILKFEPLPKLRRSRREFVVIEVRGRRPLPLALAHFQPCNQTKKQPI